MFHGLGGHQHLHSPQVGGHVLHSPQGRGWCSCSPCSTGVMFSNFVPQTKWRGGGGRPTNSVYALILVLTHRATAVPPDPGEPDGDGRRGAGGYRGALHTDDPGAQPRLQLPAQSNALLLSQLGAGILNQSKQNSHKLRLQKLQRQKQRKKLKTERQKISSKLPNLWKNTKTLQS